MADPAGGVCQLLPGKSQKEAALFAVKQCDFRCIKPVTKDMFIGREMYESFMKRAEELGLYRRQKLSLFDRMLDMKEFFVPDEIKPDNRNEYWNKLQTRTFEQNENYKKIRYSY